MGLELSPLWVPSSCLTGSKRHFVTQVLQQTPEIDVSGTNPFATRLLTPKKQKTKTETNKKTATKQSQATQQPPSQPPFKMQRKIAGYLPNGFAWNLLGQLDRQEPLNSRCPVAMGQKESAS